jgi:hypothetical protein
MGSHFRDFTALIHTTLKNRDDRHWRATTAPSNWQLWGCKPIPPFAHQRPRLGYPWQDLDRELSANFGYFRCLSPSNCLSRQSCRRCCRPIAGPDSTTAVTPQINWPTQINVIIVTIVVMQTYSNSTAPQLRESLFWRSYTNRFYVMKARTISYSLFLILWTGYNKCKARIV